MMCTLPDYILREFHENIDKVTALCSSADFDLVSKISRSNLARMRSRYGLPVLRVNTVVTEVLFWVCECVIAPDKAFS